MVRVASSNLVIRSDGSLARKGKREEGPETIGLGPFFVGSSHSHGT